MRRIDVAAAVVAIVAAAAGCSSSGSPKPQATGPGNAETAGHSSPTTSAAPSSASSSSSAPPTASSATSPTPTQPVLTAAGIAGAFLKPSDLGTEWKPLDTSDKSWDTKYAWGCTDDSHPAEIHQIGSLPTKRMTLRSYWASYIEQYVLFPNDAAAKAAQAALENQPRSCTGTHRVAGLDGGQATNDTTDFAPANVAGFTGMEKHTVSLGVTNGVNESGSVEARSGSVLVFVYYDLAAEQDSTPAKRHTTFTNASGAAVTKALQAIAASAH